MKMRAFFQKYRKDLLLIGGLILASGLLFLGTRLFRHPGNALTVEVDGVRIAAYPLDQDLSVLIEAVDGENLLLIRNGEARIGHADCRDQICVRRGAVKSAGETIVCLPHRLVITVLGEEIP